MYICYVDEAGCTGALASPHSPVQPVLVVAGIIVEQALLGELTRRYLALKRKFFPNAILANGSPPERTLDWILAEVKGADLRRAVRGTSRRKRRHAIGFLNHYIRTLGYFDIRVVGRIWVKTIGGPMNGRSVYTSSIQDICNSFQNFLRQKNSQGFIIADSRAKEKNITVAHSIFTRKFKHSGDDHRHVLEMPTFGHSENHAGIQMADLLCSALLFPIACFCYCTGHVHSIHVHQGFKILKDLYMRDIQSFQHRFEESGRWRGGIVVSDGIAQRSGKLLFC